MSGTPELLYGQRAAASVDVAATPLDVDTGETVVLEDAEILYVLYELRMSTALARLPVSLHPSVPAVMGMTFLRAGDGPLGPFTMAWIGIACRTGIKPRHFVELAFCDSAAAADFFARRYGFACQEAEVYHRETYDRVRGAVSRGGETLLDVAITDCIPLVGSGATIKYSPPLCPAPAGNGAALIQFEAAYDFKRVLRGKPRLAAYEAAALGSADVRPTHPIAGSQTVCDVHLMPARFEVDLELPAEAGGARKIAR